MVENEVLANAAAQGLGELLGLHEEPTHITRGYNYVILWVGRQVGVTVYKNGDAELHRLPARQHGRDGRRRSSRRPSRSSPPSPAWPCRRSWRS